MSSFWVRHVAERRSRFSVGPAHATSSVRMSRWYTSLGLESTRGDIRSATMRVALALCLSYVFFSSPLWAAAPGSGATFDEAKVNYDPGPTLRRGGFYMGFQQALGVGSYTGYPLEVAALNDPSQKQTTGPGLATQFSLWLGASVRDYFSFGIGASLLSANGEQVGGGLALLVRLEGYPLFYQGRFFQDLGVSFEGGLSMGAILEREDGKPGDVVADGGAMSTLGAGVFWEPLRFWHFSAGPSCNYLYAFSQTMHVHQGTLGFRFVFYGTQPKKRRSTATSTDSAWLSSHD